MEQIEYNVKPSKAEQRLAMESYNVLAQVLESLHSDNPEIEIEGAQDKIRIPLKALKLLAKILEVTSQGKPISIVPIATEMTTQAAADLLGCSRPHLVKLLEEGTIEYTRVGKHRRVKFEDVVAYKKKRKADQQKLLIQIMNADEESGLYDT
jgi:excisionase family DNA binding protein